MIFYFDLNAGHVPVAIAANFRSFFDLLRAMWTSLAADDRQAPRQEVKAGEYRREQTGQNQKQYYLAPSNAHDFTSSLIIVRSSEQIRHGARDRITGFLQRVFGKLARRISFDHYDGHAQVPTSAFEDRSGRSFVQA